MEKFKILLTCPPMINTIHTYKELLNENNINIDIPNFTQVMKEEDLIKIIGNYDGWIIGDDPATEKVFNAGINGKLKACIKWGVGVDNVDFEACKKFNIPITNIPGVFGESVSDVGIGMLLSITRQLHNIHIENKVNNWYKPCGMSLENKKICLVGFGDIGRCSARKLLSFKSNIYVSDPGFEKNNNKIICKYDNNLYIEPFLNNVNITTLEDALDNADIIFITCALNKHTRYLINKENILKCKKGVKIINVARGPIVKEDDLIELLENNYVDSVGLDVFEEEPLNIDNKLFNYKKCIFGSHNGSNAIEGVYKTSEIAIKQIKSYLNGNLEKIF